MLFYLQLILNEDKHRCNFWVHSHLTGSLKSPQTFEFCRRPSGLTDNRRPSSSLHSWADSHVLVSEGSVQRFKPSCCPVWVSGGSELRILKERWFSSQRGDEYGSSRWLSCCRELQKRDEVQHFLLVRPSIIERESLVSNEAIMEGYKSSDGFMNGLMGGFYTQQERVSGAMWRWITQNNRRDCFMKIKMFF